MNYILVAGYGWTGSSALVDLLKEYDGYYEADVEFRLIKDPKGIADLYHAIVCKWDAFNVDIAIRDFAWFTDHLYAKKAKLSLYGGLNYCNFFGENFKVATKQYLKNIVEFDYESYWWYLDFIKNSFQVLQRKLGKYLGSSKSLMYFSSINEDAFIGYTHDYINNIFEPLVNRDIINSIILDQAVSAQNCVVEMKFVPNCKVIIVDRDPRDIYADLMKDGNLIGKELQKTHDVSKYIKWHNALRRNLQQIHNCSDVLLINFEDLIMNYDKTKRTIESFLQLDPSLHSKRKQFFDPEISSKNVGLWQRNISETERYEIESALKDYLIL